MPPKSKHDQTVEKLAKQLKNDGWTVEADLPDFDQPDPIGKGQFIPDIKAEKAGAERIVEVEGERETERDRKQQETFRRHSAQKNRSTFRIVRVKSK